MTETERKEKKALLIKQHKSLLGKGKKMFNIKSIKELYTYTHRGTDTLDNIGIHARVPIRLKTLSSNELMVLAYIEIHQFSDRNFKIEFKRRKPMPVELFVRRLDISSRTVKRVLKSLKDAGIIDEVTSTNRKSKSYFSNMKKRSISYQIFTLKFLRRADVGKTTKDFLIKVMMLNNSNITNIGNISKLSEDINMSRPSINKALKELADNEFLHEVTDGIFGLNIKFMSEEFEKRDEEETADLISELFTKDEEIKMLKKELTKLRKENSILRQENEDMKKGIFKYKDMEV